MRGKRRLAFRKAAEKRREGLGGRRLLLGFFPIFVGGETARRHSLGGGVCGRFAGIFRGSPKVSSQIAFLGAAYDGSVGVVDHHLPWQLGVVKDAMSWMAPIFMS